MKLWSALLSIVVFSGLLLRTGEVYAQWIPADEQRIRWTSAEKRSLVRRPPGIRPETVATEEPPADQQFLPLNEAIRLALQNSEVIRVLTGNGAVSSGTTVYDTAIAVGDIDIAKAQFDPVLQANSAYRHSEFPFLNQAGNDLTGTAASVNDAGVTLLDRNQTGGQAALSTGNTFEPTDGEGFTTRNRPRIELSYSQPLLAGAGLRANRTAIVIARLRLEQSFFRYKSSMQNLVFGVISAYWQLVRARTELWAREQQVERLEVSLQSQKVRAEVGMERGASTAQAQASLSIARATLVSARAAVLQAEAALRNIIGLPPEDERRLVPSTPPTMQRINFDWDDIVSTAQSLDPELVELNLVLRADQERLVQRRNVARPSLSADAVYGWNGLSGKLVGGGRIRDPGLGDNTNWSLGISFSVPLSLRESRAAVRSQELILARDRAAIQQQLHRLEHDLATVLRSIEQNLAQYDAFHAAREAAWINVELQRAERTSGRSILLNELLAITDWANTVASEAQALTAYNTELARLELSTATILDTHGVRFSEEQFGAVGPHGILTEDVQSYPRSLRAETETTRYPDSQQPAEDAFGLTEYPAEVPAQDQPALPNGQ
jgi:outer membrane protein TolC